jgi:hypothetical protein
MSGIARRSLPPVLLVDAFSPCCCEEVVKISRELWWSVCWCCTKIGLLMGVSSLIKKRIGQASGRVGLRAKESSRESWGLCWWYIKGLGETLLSLPEGRGGLEAPCHQRSGGGLPISALKGSYAGHFVEKQSNPSGALVRENRGLLIAVYNYREEVDRLADEAISGLGCWASAVTRLRTKVETSGALLPLA